MRKIICFVMVLLLIPLQSFAEIIRLKDSQIIKGHIVEQNDEYLQVDIGLETLFTFYLEEIEEISSEFTGEVYPIQGQDPENVKFYLPKWLEKERKNRDSVQQKSNQAGDQKENESVKQNFLWKVVSGKSTVYLFGSIHLGKKSMYPLADIIEKSFAESSSLVVEVNVDAIPPLEAMKKLYEKGLFYDGTHLEQVLSQQTMHQLVSRLSRYNMLLEDIFVYKPWLVALTLQMLQIKQLGFDEEYGIDRYFLRKARDSKKILELETLDEQLVFLDSLPNQDSFLKYTLESLDETESMLTQVIQAWEEGDHRMLEKILITDIRERQPDAEGVFEVILYERNKKMTQRIKHYFQADQTYFVVVGAAHLIGEEGIVELLRKEGFEVNQL